MKKSIVQSISGIIALLFVNSTSLFSQTITIHAGANQIINWEETHSARLKGNVPSNQLKVEWTCPQNPEVSFQDVSNPVTEVTFPRPGYYLLILSVQGAADPARSTTIVNVFKSNSYQERLSDLIGLMTVDEKIKQLTNQSDAIPRLGVAKYDYWSEALHGLLASGATSFSSWEPRPESPRRDWTAPKSNCPKSSGT